MNRYPPVTISIFSHSFLLVVSSLFSPCFLPSSSLLTPLMWWLYMERARLREEWPSRDAFLGLSVSSIPDPIGQCANSAFNFLIFAEDEDENTTTTTTRRHKTKNKCLFRPSSCLSSLSSGYSCCHIVDGPAMSRKNNRNFQIIKSQKRDQTTEKKQLCHFHHHVVNELPFLRGEVPRDWQLCHG